MEVCHRAGCGSDQDPQAACHRPEERREAEEQEELSLREASERISEDGAGGMVGGGARGGQPDDQSRNTQNVQA